MLAFPRWVGWVVVGAVVGFLVGAFGAAMWNHLDCSTATQVANGCTIAHPHVVGRLGAIVGGVAGIFVGSPHVRRGKL